MIKTALKHWIYETCIDMVFDNIFMNFISATNSPAYQRGMRYITVTTKNRFVSHGQSYNISKTYYNVEIVDILTDYIVIDFHTLLVVSDTKDYFIPRREGDTDGRLSNGQFYRSYRHMRERDWISVSNIVNKREYAPGDPQGCTMSCCYDETMRRMGND